MRGFALLAVLLLDLGGCARPGRPPGGPEDRIPPVVVGTWPDTFAVVEPTRDPIRIEFSERISERPLRGTLNEAVIVSPTTGESRVKHTRRGLEVSLLGGLRPGTVYRVTVLPVIKDLFGNPMPDAFEFVFSTGPPFPPNALAGLVTDRLTGEAVEDARVDARLRTAAPEDPTHTTRTDTAGVFALRFLPPGRYELAAYVDRNRNGEPDFQEPQAFGVQLLGETDTLVVQLALLLPDTTPARLVRAEAVDSFLLRLEFDDYLDPESSLARVGVRLSREGEEGPSVLRILHEHEVEAFLRARADSLARAAGEEPSPPEEAEAPGEGGGEEAPPLPGRGLAVVLGGALEPRRPYDLSVTGIVNINGVPGGGGETVVAWEPPELPGDTAAADTLARPDTTTPPDTSRYLRRRE